MAPAGLDRARADARAFVLRWRFSILLGVLVAGLVVEAGIGHLTLGAFSSELFLVALILGATAATDAGRAYIRAIVLLLVAHLGLTAADAALDLPPLLSAGRVLATAAITALVLWLTVEELLVDRTVYGADALAGAAFGFMLIGLCFAMIFAAGEVAQPGSFKLTDPDNALTELIYFSYITLTTTGFGDVTPLAPLARIAAALESVIGTLYTAMLVGRLMVIAFERRMRK